MELFSNGIISNEYLISLPTKLTLVASVIVFAMRSGSKPLFSFPFIGLSLLTLSTFFVGPLGNAAMVWYHENITVVTEPWILRCSISLADAVLLAVVILLAAIYWNRCTKSSVATNATIKES